MRETSLVAVGIVPGTGVAVIGLAFVALVDDDARSSTVKLLWTCVVDDDPIDEVLERLGSAGIRSLPSFVLAAPEGDDLRIVARGGVTASVGAAAGSPLATVDPAASLTWVDRLVPQGRLTLALDGDLSELGPFVAVGGVLPACRLEVDLAPRSIAERFDDLPAPGAMPIVDDWSERADTAPPILPILDLPDLAEPSAPETAEATDLDPIGDESALVDSALEAGADPDPDLDTAVEAGADPDPDLDTALEAGADPDPDLDARLEDAAPAPTTEGGETSGDFPTGVPNDVPVEVATDTIIEPPSPVAPPIDAPGEATIAPGSEATTTSDTAVFPDLAGDDPEPPASAGVPAEPPLPSDGYDSLFGATQHRSVESAAMRPEPTGDHDPGAAASPPPFGPPAAAPATPPPATPPFAAPPFAPLAAPPAATAISGAPSSPRPHGGDHDGLTIGLAELQAMRSGAPGSPLGAPPVSPVGAPAGTPLQDPPGSPMVHAIRCPLGHLNPTHSSVCRACGGPVQDQAQITVPRPVLGRLRFSTGVIEDLDRPMLIGRAPRIDGSVNGQPPLLVVVPSPEREISGTHIEIRLEGWQVLVIDRASTNGTTIRLPGRAPHRIRAGEPFPIVPGTSVSLADEVDFTFEVTS